MRSETPVEAAALDVLTWLQEREWRGFDPFDLLRSPWSAPFRATRWSSVAWLQLGRRSPVDLRPVLSVRPHVNPKALALGIQGCLALERVAFPGGAMDGSAFPTPELLDRVLALERPGGGWGYPFPWANRHFAVAADTPSSVATAFVGQALLDALEAGYDVPGAGPALERACAFIVDCLQRVEADGGFLLSYTPEDRRGVHNASIMAAALVARAAPVCGFDRGPDVVASATAATLRAQRSDGSWPYGVSRRDGFVDSFHTGYVLSALKTLAEAPGAGGPGVDEALDRGLSYWRATFLGGPAVAHRPRRPWPVDLHAVAQGILTCLEFRDRWTGGRAEATRLALWALDNARNTDGSFVYLWSPGRINRIKYLRWVEAWMFRALAELSACGDSPG